MRMQALSVLFFFQAEDGIRDLYVTGVQTCALPISRASTTRAGRRLPSGARGPSRASPRRTTGRRAARPRSEEHTSELQSRRDLVCRLLLEKKKKKKKQNKKTNEKSMIQ